MGSGGLSKRRLKGIEMREMHGKRPKRNLDSRRSDRYIPYIKPPVGIDTRMGWQALYESYFNMIHAALNTPSILYRRLK